MVSVGPGSILHGRFVVERALGRGGMASVWLANDRLGSGPTATVALKVLHPELRRRKNMVQRLEKEAAVLRTLAHPGIAAALGFFEDDAFVSLVMEYVEGVTLERWLGERNLAGRSLSIEELVEIFDALLDPIEHAHALGILHRDLKPQNIMLDGSRLKVLDFGIAKLLEGDLHDATTQGRRVGSPYYMSPEQTVGDPVDARSDIFSLGSIFFEMITLRRAWLLNIRGERLAAFVDDIPDAKANGVLEISARIAGAARPRVGEYRADLGAAARGLEEIVFRALAIEPGARFSTVGELRSAVRAVFGAPAVFEGTPTIEKAPELEPTVAVERAPVSEPTALGDRPPAVEGTQALERTPVLERTPLGDRTPAIEETQALERTPLGDRTSAIEETQALERTPVLTRPTLLLPPRVERRAFGLGMFAASLVGIAVLGAAAWGVVRGRSKGAETSRATAVEVDVRARAVPKIEARASSGTSSEAIADAPALEDVPGSEDAPGTEDMPGTEHVPGTEDAPAIARAADRARTERNRSQPASAPDRFAALDRLLVEARRAPADAARKARLAEELARVAAEVRDPARRRRILRVAETSAITGDLEGLESALEELKRAL